MSSQDHQQICRGIWSNAIDSQQLFTKFKSGQITCLERFKIEFSGSNTKSKIVNRGRAITYTYFFPDELRSGGGNCFRCGEGLPTCVFFKRVAKFIDQFQSHIFSRGPERVCCQDSLDHIFEEGWRAKDTAKSTFFHARQLRFS